VGCENEKGSRSCLCSYAVQCSGRALDVAVLLTETLDTAGGINDLLLAGVERVAFGADFDVQGLGVCGAGLEVVAAAAGDVDFDVVWMH